MTRIRKNIPAGMTPEEPTVEETRIQDTLEELMEPVTPERRTRIAARRAG